MHFLAVEENEFRLYDLYDNDESHFKAFRTYEQFKNYLDEHDVCCLSCSSSVDEAVAGTGTPEVVVEFAMAFDADGEGWE